MSFELTHFDEQKLILVRVYGTVSLDEHHEIGRSIRQALDQAQGVQDLFFDLRQIGRFPTSLRQLRNTSILFQTPRLGFTILLMSNNALLRFVAPVVLRFQTMTECVRTFELLEDALTFLHTTQENSDERRQWLKEMRTMLDIHHQ